METELEELELREADRELWVAKEVGCFECLKAGVDALCVGGNCLPWDDGVSVDGKIRGPDLLENCFVQFRRQLLSLGSL